MINNLIQNTEQNTEYKVDHVGQILSGEITRSMLSRKDSSASLFPFANARGLGMLELEIGYPSRGDSLRVGIIVS